MKRITSILSVILICLGGFGAHAQNNEYNLDERYEINQDGTIHLQSDDAEVSIQGADRSDVHLVVHRKIEVDGWEMESDGKFSIEVENRNGDLYIRENDENNMRVMIGSIDEEYQITMEVPHDIALDLEGDDDFYNISDINGEVFLNADDAEAEFSRVTAANFDFNIDDGSIRMDQGRGTLKLNMDDGEIYVQKADFREISADYDDGEVDITTVLADEGKYEFDMDDGELSLNIAGGGGTFSIDHDDGTIRTGDSFGEISSDEDQALYRLGGGEAHIEIETDDGEIELRTI